QLVLPGGRVVGGQGREPRHIRVQAPLDAVVADVDDDGRFHNQVTPSMALPSAVIVPRPLAPAGPTPVRSPTTPPGLPAPTPFPGAGGPPRCRSTPPCSGPRPLACRSVRGRAIPVPGG